MPNFAKINNNIVTEVVALTAESAPDEQTGINFLNNLYHTQDNWKETTSNNTKPSGYAGIGYNYDSNTNIFFPPTPYASWILNSNTYEWEPPVPYPDDGQMYIWDEQSQSWTLLNI